MRGAQIRHPRRVADFSVCKRFSVPDRCPWATLTLRQMPLKPGAAAECVPRGAGQARGAGGAPFTLASSALAPAPADRVRGSSPRGPSSRLAAASPGSVAFLLPVHLSRLGVAATGLVLPSTPFTFCPREREGRMRLATSDSEDLGKGYHLRKKGFCGSLGRPGCRKSRPGEQTRE